MASNIPADDWDFYRRVINKNWTQLLNDLDPVSTIDAFIETNYITSLQARDISELPSTSEKIRKILDIATKKGPKGYVDFKECLRKSNQEYLVEILEKTEKELIKKRKDEAARKEAERAKKLVRPPPFKPQIVNKKKPSSTGELLYNRFSPAGAQENRNIVAYPVQRQAPPRRRLEDGLPVGDSEMTRQEESKRVTYADLMNIATDVIGENWELMAPFFDIKDETVKRIQADKQGDTKRQLYEMLLVWSQQSASNATLQNLERILREVPGSVYINWNTFDDIMRQSSSEERPYEPTFAPAPAPVPAHIPAHVPASGSLPGEDISQRMDNLSVSNVPYIMGNTRRQGGDVSNDYQPDISRGFYPAVLPGSQPDADHVRSTTGNSHRGTTTNDCQGTGADEPDAMRVDVPSGDFSLLAAANVGTGSSDPLTIIQEQVEKLKLEKGSTTSTPGIVLRRPNYENRREPPVANPDNTDGRESVVPRCFHNPDEKNGRLKTFTKQDMVELENFCPKKIGGGGFGEVYKARDKMPGLGITVVLKKIICSALDEEKMRSITNEKLASRTMHFAIVPLIGYGSYKVQSERTFCFVTPYMEKGDLATAIQDNVLTLERRIKILYHVASAIHFLHTPVNKFRRAILHMDIKSLNIVLDQWYNARLIDFGLAREMNEDSDYVQTTKVQIPYTKGYFKTITYGQLDVYADYYNFGVVIRELVTGQEPFIDNRVPLELRDYSDRKLNLNILPLWKDSNNSNFQITDDLLKLSDKCLEKNASKRDDDKKLNSKYILDLLKEHIGDKLLKTWETSGNKKKCDMCMQYDAVDDNILEHNKECGMKVCVSCMRHSYCNPIICHSCGEEIVPNIGQGWNAVLIAGNDVEKAKLAEVFSKDIEEVKKVITSRCPLVMGISEENVFTIKPKSPGTSESMKKTLTDQLKKCLAEPLEENTHTCLMPKTLLLFYSGHYVEGYGFQLGSKDEFITIEELQKHLLGSDSTAEKSLRLIIFLDCCCAPGVKIDDFGDKRAEIILVQINACRDKHQSFAENEGSIFQRLFTQALTGKALSSSCRNITRNTNECSKCCIPMNKGFVTLYNLHEFIDDHYGLLCVGKELDKPTVYVHNAQSKDIRIGYVVNFPVDLKFFFELPGCDVPKAIPHSMFSNIESLRTVLFEYLKEKMGLNDSTEQGPRLSTTYFRDILLIFSKGGPKDAQKIELDTIEKVNVAWNARRDLYVSLRTKGTSLIGRFFDKTSLKPIVDYLFKKGEKTNGIENTMEVTTNFDNFFYFIDNSQQSLKVVADGLDHLHEFKTKFEKDQQVTCTNLSVNFPYDEEANPKFRNDFLSFRLVID